MILSREQLSAAMFASKDPARYAMQNIAVHPDGTVYGTNGHVLVKVARTEESRNPEDYPVAALGLPEDAKTPAGVVYLPADAALGAVKRIPNGRRCTLPVLGNAYLAVSDSTVFLATTDLERPEVTRIPVVQDVTFPDCERVIPQTAAKSEPYGMDPGYLGLVARYAGIFGDKLAVKITGRGPLTPASFEWTRDGHTVLALVMPMRLQ